MAPTFDRQLLPDCFPSIVPSPVQHAHLDSTHQHIPTTYPRNYFTFFPREPTFALSAYSRWSSCWHLWLWVALFASLLPCPLQNGRGSQVGSYLGRSPLAHISSCSYNILHWQACPRASSITTGWPFHSSERSTLPITAHRSPPAWRDRNRIGGLQWPGHPASSLGCSNTGTPCH